MNKTKNIRYVSFLSIVAALGGFLFGYDTAVISGTVSQVSAQFQLSAMQSGWYVGCALVGSIAGVIFAGVLSDKLGRKKTMILSAVLFSTSAIGCAIAANIDQLVIYRIVGGIGIGIVSIVCPLYISEVSPASHRGRMVSLYQLAVTVGFLGAYLMNYYISENSLIYSSSNKTMMLIFGTEIWRGMLGAETIPALLFFVVIFFIPESPRWLIVKNREPEAFSIFSKIYTESNEVGFQINETKQMLNSEKTAKSALLLRAEAIDSLISLTL